MDMMEARFRMMAMQEVGLPAEYEEVEYLEASGTQHIDTGLIMNQNSFIECKIVLKRTGSNNEFYYGASVTYNDRSFECYRWNDDMQFNFVSAQKIDVTSIPDLETVITKQGKDDFSVEYNGDVLYNDVHYTITFETPVTLWLFGLHRTGSSLHGKVKIYYAKIKNNGSIQRDYVACIRISDSKPGMYDLKTKTFYTNAGTGEFGYKKLNGTIVQPQ